MRSVSPFHAKTRRIGFPPGAGRSRANVHNPAEGPASLRFKFASTQRDARPGRISRFAEIRLGPDQAISLGCARAYELLSAKAEFVDGFAVIESGAGRCGRGLYGAKRARRSGDFSHRSRTCAQDATRPAAAFVFPNLSGLFLPQAGGHSCAVRSRLGLRAPLGLRSLRAGRVFAGQFAV